MSDEPLLVAVDMETTGLLPARNEIILEVGLMVFDYEIWEPVDYWECIITHDDFDFLHGCLARMPKEARVMHEASGLLDQVFNADEPGWPLDKAEQAAMEFLDQYFPGERGGLGPMVGNSVHFDREYAREWMPRLFDRFAYRNIDVSTLKELCKRFNPRIYTYVEATLGEARAHRVQADLQRTLRELELYSEEFLLVPGGFK